MVEVRSHVIAAALHGRGPARRRPRHGPLAHPHAVARPPGLTAAAAAAAAGAFFPGGFEGIAVRATGRAARRGGSPRRSRGTVLGAPPRARATSRARGGRAARVHAGGMGACLTRKRAGAAALRLRCCLGGPFAARLSGARRRRRGARDLSAVRPAPQLGTRCHVSVLLLPPVLTCLRCHVARSRRSFFLGVRGLLAGDGSARAADDMAALAWQLGAGAGAEGPTSRDDGGDGGFGFATAASPLAAMLAEARPPMQ